MGISTTGEQELSQLDSFKTKTTLLIRSGIQGYLAM